MPRIIPTGLSNDCADPHGRSKPSRFAPPKGFEPLDTDEARAAYYYLKSSALEGKQVWYITAPASLPVTVVQDLTIPMDQAQKGMPVLSHNGEDYRMAFDNPAASSAFRLLIPNKKGVEYSLCQHALPPKKSSV